MTQSMLFIAGTRPEVIKVVPAVVAARQIHDDVTLLLTGQHKEMARQALTDFDVAADAELDVMRAGASLAALTQRLINEIDAYFGAHPPAVVVVQGDTTSAAVAGLMAFYRGIPVAHIEAGLRSRDNRHPFPEEVNRKIVSTYAAFNFAPTPLARGNLLSEQVSADTILVTGNTVVDAVEMMKQKLPPPPFDGVRRILVTTHRRESWGQDIANICRAIRLIADNNPDVQVLLPVHRNPVVAEPVNRILGGHPRVTLTDPLDYLDLQKALSESYLTLTDSGGIQEEAPSYGVPVLVLRRVTERPEAVNAGLAQVVGTDRDAIVDACQRLLDDPAVHRQMAGAANPFGDGYAGRRIAAALKRFVDGEAPVFAGIDVFEGGG